MCIFLRICDLSLFFSVFGGLNESTNIILALINLFSQIQKPYISFFTKNAFFFFAVEIFFFFFYEMVSKKKKKMKMKNSFLLIMLISFLLMGVNSLILEEGCINFFFFLFWIENINLGIKI